MGLDDCDGSCSGIYLLGCRTLSHEQCDMDLARRDFGYALVMVQEKARNYFRESMEVYSDKYRIVVG